MNTDNMSVAGETIDYGPCAFMDIYHPGTVFSSIDHQGRYAYGNQPPIAQWNLACLAQALLPFLGENEVAAEGEMEAVIASFPPLFEKAWTRGMRQKLGLEEVREGDMDLGQDLLNIMTDNRADFTNVFRRLSDLDNSETEADENFRELFGNPSSVDDWLRQWRVRLTQEKQGAPQRQQSMRRANPVYIPRNHLVEEVIKAALENDFQPFHELTKVLETPFDEQAVDAKFSQPPRPDQIVRETFCGT